MIYDTKGKYSSSALQYFIKSEWSASHFQLEFNQMTRNIVKNIEEKKKGNKLRWCFKNAYSLKLY